MAYGGMGSLSVSIPRGALFSDWRRCPSISPGRWLWDEHRYSGCPQFDLENCYGAAIRKILTFPSSQSACWLPMKTNGGPLPG